MIPGSRPTVQVVFAAMGERCATPMSTGKASRVPPPAAAFTAPATSPARKIQRSLGIRFLAQRAKNGSFAGQDGWWMHLRTPSNHPAAAAREGQIRPQDDDRANDRRDPAVREAPPAVGDRVVPEHRAHDEGAHARRTNKRGSIPTSFSLPRPDQSHQSAAGVCYTPQRRGNQRIGVGIRPSSAQRLLHPSSGHRAPFDFALSARVLRRSTHNVVDRVEEDGTWSRVIVLGEGPALVSGHQHGDGVTFEAAPANTDDHRTLAALVTRIFSLDVELAPFFRRLRREPGLAEVARRCAGLRPQRFASLFETLANGLACQQLSLDSGLMRLGRLCERFGPRTPDGARVGPPDFERIADAPVSLLRQAGFSNRRAAELRELARLPLDRFEP